MDLFLIDQLLKSNLPDGPVLDLGCGTGRNTIFFWQHGYEITALDADEKQIQLLRHFLSGSSDQNLRLVTSPAQSIPASSESFETIICSRLLHLLPSAEDFEKAWEEIHRVLRPGGFFYFTMNSTLGLDITWNEIENGLYQYPDGNRSLLLDQALLEKIESDSRFRLLETPRFLVFGQTRSEAILLLRKK